MQNRFENVEIKEALKREHATLVAQWSEGRIVTRPDGTILSDILDGETLCRRVRELGLERCDQYCVRSHDAADAICREFGLHGQTPCVQAVYLKKQPPELAPCDIRPLGQEYAEFLAAHYHPEQNNLDYLRDRIACGRMWGLFDNGTLAGFIGMHDEGSMGLLEILPEYRRRGYGYLLEGSLIRLHLERGWVPFCHVVEGNDASMRLQEKLGMTFSELPAIWVF